jgi:hypothetical protein
MLEGESSMVIDCRRQHHNTAVSVSHKQLRRGCPREGTDSVVHAKLVVAF